MCGRFSLTSPGDLLAETFALAEAMSLPPRYNIAPSQPVVVVRQTARAEPPRWARLRWGLIPSWCRPSTRTHPFVNARSASAAARPAFREAFLSRRCLIPADGFYEWKPAGRTKLPYYIRLRDGGPFGFAGLWEPPPPDLAEGGGSCTILTTEPNDLVRGIHDRMPVIVEARDYDRWLDPDLQAPGLLRALLRVYPAKRMVAYPVSTRVNDPQAEGPECVRPVSPQRSLLEL